MMHSLLQQRRLVYQPPLPRILEDLSKSVLCPHGAANSIAEPFRKLFPHTHAATPFRVERGDGKSRKLIVGALFSGGQAAGGHNVLAGLFDGLKKIHVESVLLGFLDGVAGLIENRYKILDSAAIDSIRNQGGFDLIGSSRTKIDTPEQFQKAAAAVKIHQLDTLIVIGGDDSNTNAAFLAEYFLEQKIATRVIGVPKTIDGDLRSVDIEMSFGFDSACKTYSELIGNIARDALSSKKYYHFIKLMGRSASHVTLECALSTCPNLALIGEERRSLSAIVTDIADLVIERKKAGKEFGVLLVPEGLVEFVPELTEHISNLPGLERDPHGNINVSKIETEQLIGDFVKKELEKRGVKLNVLQHFFGYEGRACFPSNFDSNYTYALGMLGAMAARDGLTGMILAIRGLKRPVAEWVPKAVPLVQLIHFEIRSGKEKPVIAKTLVDLKGPAFRHFENERRKWRLADCYRMPGPIQFFGDSELTDSIPITL